MSGRTVFLFSGQGSHYYQMGRELFDQDTSFHRSMLELDSIICDCGGQSVVRSLYTKGFGKADLFDDIAITHPAIFMVELSVARALAARDIVPDYVLGASLGAFAAAVIAGCLSAEQALLAVVEQAKIVSANCARGGMIAVLESPALFHQSALSDMCEMAARNFETNFVVTTKEEQLPAVEALLRAKGVAFERLALHYAFHSRWIDEAEQAYRTFLEVLELHPARIPIVCCMEATRLTSIPRHYFWEVARRQIRFPEAIAQLERIGEWRYIDAGPSGTLATYLKYVLAKSSRSEIHRVLSPFGGDLASLQSLAPYRAVSV